MIQNDVLDSAKLEGREEGREEGRKEGREEGRKEGIEVTNLENAKKMKSLGVSPEIIKQVTGFSIEELE